MDRSRRELIRGGLRVGAVALAADAAALGTGAALASPAAAATAQPASTGIAKLFSSASTDTEVVQGLVVVEQLLAFSYQHLLSAGGLSGSTRPMIRAFLSHERAHLRLLSAALERRGASVPPPPSDVAHASRALAGLGAPGSLRRTRTETDSIHYLIGGETVAEGAYYQAMAKLSDRTLAASAVQTMACQAQHWSALSGLLHAGDVNRAVPYPVVLG